MPLDRKLICPRARLYLSIFEYGDQCQTELRLSKGWFPFCDQDEKQAVIKLLNW
jgi:hypothetical protein